MASLPPSKHATQQQQMARRERERKRESSHVGRRNKVKRAGRGGRGSKVVEGGFGFAMVVATANGKRNGTK